MFTILAFNGMFHLPYFFMGAVKIIPGFNIFPWWATIAFLSVKRKERRENALRGIYTPIKHYESRTAQNSPNSTGKGPTQPQYIQEPAPPAPASYKQESVPTMMAGSVKIPKSANGIEGIVAYKPPPQAANDTDKAAVERARYKNYQQEPAPPSRFKQEPAPEDRFKQEPAPPSKFKPEPVPPPQRFKPEPAPPPVNSNTPKRNAA
jgi:hypothetical protein